MAPVTDKIIQGNTLIGIVPVSTPASVPSTTQQLQPIKNTNVYSHYQANALSIQGS